MMPNIGFRVRSNFKRPARDLVEKFRGLPVANIADCMNRISCLDAAIVPFNRTPLLGCALTVRSTGGDNLLFHKALDLAQAGDVIVVADGGTPNRSCCGEIMVKYAISRGLAGFIVDACIRDRYAIAELDFPVYARGVTPNGPYKNGPGEINFPASCGGIVINPGDILIGDGDGVVVIKPEEAAELAETTRKVFEKEEKSMADIDAGRGMDRTWIDKFLAEKNCEFVD
jgi:regulator of RNase E activity RraA